MSAITANALSRAPTPHTPGRTEFGVVVRGGNGEWPSGTVRAVAGLGRLFAQRYLSDCDTGCFSKVSE